MFGALEFIDKKVGEINLLGKTMMEHKEPMAFLAKNYDKITSVIEGMNNKREEFERQGDLVNLGLYDEGMKQLSKMVSNIQGMAQNSSNLLKKILIIQIHLTKLKDFDNEFFIIECYENDNSEILSKKLEKVKEWVRIIDEETLARFFNTRFEKQKV